MQQLITSRGSGRWEIVALCTENFQTRSSSYTYHVEGVGWKMSLVPVSSWITLKFVQEDVSLSLFSKKRERQKEARSCRVMSPLPSPPTCKGRLVRVFNVVLDRAKNVRAIRKLHTWMRGDSRCSIYVTCNWPRGKNATVIWHSWSH